MLHDLAPSSHYMSKIGHTNKFGTRLAVTMLFMAMVFAGSVGAASPAKADRATDFMKRVARDLVAATRTKSASPIARVIHKYADVHGIGRFSLGRYSRHLYPKSPNAKRRAKKNRKTYQNGMVRFMARFAASQLPKYPVRSAKILGRSFPYRGQTGVDSRVTLRNGTGYDVRWLLVKWDGSYKVRDAEVLGFRMKEGLRGLFTNHIEDRKKGGSVRALVTVLNR